MQETMRDVIKTKTKGWVLIDTRWTIDSGWETMVFKCNSKGVVKNWAELDCTLYENQREANVRHSDMINKWMNK